MLSRVLVVLFIPIVCIAFYDDYNGDDYSIIFKSKPRVSACEVEGERPVYEHNYDVIHYKLVHNIDVDNEEVSGSTYITVDSMVDGLDEINFDFDFESQEVDGCYRDGNNLDYTENTDYITIELDRTFNTGERFTIQIDHHGHPADGLFFKSGYVYTLTEPSESHYWFPCYDDPSDKADTSETIITVPEDYYVASNGKLMSIQDNGDWKTYHWYESYPIAMYLISINCYPYVILENEYHGMPVLTYVAPELEEEAEITFEHQDEILECYSTRFGIEYPFIEERYSNAGAPFYGGMENQTCTAIGNYYINGDHSSDWLLAHECAHSWWGDMVTCETWKDFWLNEGFATYSDALFKEWFEGWDAFYNRMQQFKYAYFNEDESNRFPIYDPDYMWGATVYQKGAWVLHMLRHIMGDDEFFGMLADYGETYKYGTVVTSELEEEVNEHYGEDMGWYFWEWVYKAGYPEYEWEWWQEYDGGWGDVHLHIVQVQEVDDETPLFKMPIDILIEKGSGEEVVVVWNDEEDEEYVIGCNEEVIGVEFDPDGWLLCKEREGVGIEIEGFELREGGGGVRVRWEVIGECVGYFDLYRRVVGSSSSDLVVGGVGVSAGDIWEKVNGYPIEGEGEHVYMDEGVEAGYEYEYRLEYIEGVEVEEAGRGVIEYSGKPGSFYVMGGYPNPFSEVVRIEVGIDEGGEIGVRVYDISGRLVRELMEGEVVGGVYRIEWDGRSVGGDKVSDGVYLIMVELDGDVITKKVILQR